MEPKVKLALPGRFAISQLVMDDMPVTLVPLPELTLRATYFDTRDLRLARHGAELRHRTGEEDGPPWTLKLAVAPSGSASERTEIHFPDLTREPPAAARALVTALARSEPLTAVATLRTRRRPIRLLVEERDIGIALEHESQAAVCLGATSLEVAEQRGEACSLRASDVPAESGEEHVEVTRLPEGAHDGPQLGLDARPPRGVHRIREGADVRVEPAERHPQLVHSLRILGQPRQGVVPHDALEGICQRGPQDVGQCR
jgi:hypothetical protein